MQTREQIKEVHGMGAQMVANLDARRMDSVLEAIDAQDDLWSARALGAARVSDNLVCVGCS